METAYQDSYPAGYPPGPKSRSWLWASLFVVLMAVLGVLVFFIGHNEGWWGTPANLKVPYLKGDSVAEAKALLKQKDFGDVTMQPEHSTLVPDGQVMGTVPAAGATLKPGTPIVLDVSTGPPLATVPELVKQPCAAADSTLIAKGFSYKNVPRRSRTIGSGLVISTSPAGHQRYQLGRAVTVYCSSGVATTVVPNLQGYNEAQAGEKLNAVHLKVGNVRTVPNPAIKAGLVAYTSPAAGDPEPWGTAVDLYVSGGQQMTNVPPNLVGENQQKAQSELAAVDLFAAIVPQPVSNPAQDGYVISTDPAPGKPIRQGSSVTLYVGQYTGPTTTRPSRTTTSSTTTVPTSTTTTTRRNTTTTSRPGTTTTTSGPGKTTTTSGPGTTTTTSGPGTTTTTSGPGTTTTLGPTSTTTSPPGTTTTTSGLPGPTPGPPPNHSLAEPGWPPGQPGQVANGVAPKGPPPGPMTRRERANWTTGDGRPR